MKIKALYVSDLHLGSKSSNPKKFLNFIKSYEFEELYLIGDIIDGWQLVNSFYWNKDYDEIIRYISELQSKVYLMPGNHDEFLRKFEGMTVNGVEIKNEVIVKRDKCKYLVFHGDSLERNLNISNRLYHIGSYIYSYMLFFDRTIKKLGININFARLIKQKTKKFISYLSNYEDEARKKAKELGCTTVIIGHLHTPLISSKNSITYINSGDWVENCCGVVEYLNGGIEIVYADNIRV